MLVRVLLALSALALLVGASLPVQSDDDPGPWETGGSHDHRDPSHHRAMERNLDLTSWSPLGADAHHMAGAHAMEVRAGHLFVAAFGDEYSASGGLYVLDVADGDRPVVVGHLPGLGPMGGDRSLDVTVDGHFAVLGTEALPAAYTKTGILNPTPSGLLLVDTRDKANPILADYHPSLGVHSVIVARVNGSDYVYTSDALNQPFSVYRIDREPVPQLTPVGRLLVRHDGSVHHDPTLGTLLITADGSTSATIPDLVQVYNLSANPAAPPKIGNWTMPNASIHYAHSALMTTLEGKRVLVATSENGGPDPTPVWFLDASGDLWNMSVLGKWTPPVGGGNGLIFSLHNPRIVDGVLYFAHYHAGVVVFDVGTVAKLANPVLLGYHVPSKDLGYRAPLDPAQQAAGIDAIHYPRVYDVAVNPVTRNFYAADIWTGVYAYAPV